MRHKGFFGLKIPMGTVSDLSKVVRVQLGEIRRFGSPMERSQELPSPMIKWLVARQPAGLPTGPKGQCYFLDVTPGGPYSV